MNKIGDTELIINDENRVYHLNLQKHEIANNSSTSIRKKTLPGAPPQGQFSFHVDYPPEIERLFQSIKDIELDDITPREALDKLAQIINDAKNS